MRCFCVLFGVLFWGGLAFCGEIPDAARPAGETNGFLVFELDRYAYGDGHRGGSEIKRKFEVPLTEEFLANFSVSPNGTLAGTGFCCGAGHSWPSTHDATFGFTWWLNQTPDHRWYVHMWGEGTEKIKGVTISSGNPGVTQGLTIKRLEDLDMSYQQSYVNEYDGVNVQFSAKYVAAKDIDAEGPMFTASVRKGDRTMLSKGDNPGNDPIQLFCVFQ